MKKTKKLPKKGTPDLQTYRAFFAVVLRSWVADYLQDRKSGSNKKADKFIKYLQSPRQGKVFAAASMCMPIQKANFNRKLLEFVQKLERDAIEEGKI